MMEVLRKIRSNVVTALMSIIVVMEEVIRRNFGRDSVPLRRSLCHHDCRPRDNSQQTEPYCHGYKYWSYRTSSHCHSLFTTSIQTRQVPPMCMSTVVGEAKIQYIGFRFFWILTFFRVTYHVDNFLTSYWFQYVIHCFAIRWLASSCHHGFVLTLWDWMMSDSRQNDVVIFEFWADRWLAIRGHNTFMCIPVCIMYSNYEPFNSCCNCPIHELNRVPYPEQYLGNLRTRRHTRNRRMTLAGAFSPFFCHRKTRYRRSFPTHIHFLSSKKVHLNVGMIPILSLIPYIL